ncbi:MAG: hypothetical protein IJZ47_10515 [Oscillospiraceae bacterium]|nr:hypothetical protein [Oscillospiraceae bacterium]
MTIYINGVAFDKVTVLSADRETRRTEINYNTQGDMLIDLVNRKYRLKVVFGLLTGEELASLRSLTAEIFVTVRFTAPEGEVEAQFHVVNEPAPAVTKVNGVTLYSGTELIFLQK